MLSGAWAAVALSADIPPATAAPARLEGAEIVLWRDAGGTLQAWEDRCPHRGMRLSFGFVREGRLTCLYHGWQFDASARCRHIPAHPELKVPGTIRAKPWPLRERAGLVWVSGDETAAGTVDDTMDDTGLPEAPMRGLRSLAVRRPRALLAARLGIGASGWTWRDGALLALHAANAETTMLHLALPEIADPAQRRQAMAAAVALRDALEAA